MLIRKKFFLWIVLLFGFHSLSTISLKEELKNVGYREMSDKEHGAATFGSLYAYFDELIAFLQTNPAWAQKLYAAKERFIRSKDRNCYSADFFGFYDESKREGRRQISFYYSVHFHEFINAHYSSFKQVLPINRFLQACYEIQKSYAHIFYQVASELGVETIFGSTNGVPPILFKVIKYLPSYVAPSPHYDGTAFSLFLDSTDNQSLLLSPYKSSFSQDDFFCPARKFSREYSQNSILLIPGTLLTEFGLNPTPHVVIASGKVRYATIAFAMRPNYSQEKNHFPLLSNIKY